VKASFQIRLHSKDKARALRLFSKGTFEKILEQIKSYFCAGRIYKQESESVQLRVESVKDLAKVLDHFDRYLLITQKRADYELFKQAVELLQNKKHLTMEGLRKIVGIKASMNKGLSVRSELKAAFPDTISVPRPLVKDQEIKDPH
jgi:LAGLIDADG endonuclease